MYVRPQIITRDKQACDHIIKKMHEEEITEAIQKQWYVQERQETRARLMRQKEKNISAEAKAGVVKNYTPVGLSMVAAHDSMTQDENGIRLSMTTANVPPALNTFNQSSQEKIKSDCINLATSQEASQEGAARRATKSASRVRAEGYNTRKENDEILTYDNDFDVQQASLEQLKLKAQL